MLIENWKETENYVTFTIGSYISKEKKFLCVGGEFAGLYKARIQIMERNYTTFNNAGYSKTHKQIHVHKSLL